MILLDSSFLIALFNADDALHARAKKFQNSLGDQKLILAEYVILEISTILAMRASVSKAQEAITFLLAAKETQYCSCSPIFQGTIEKMFAQKKFQLSFVDCALLVLLENKQAEKLITFDTTLAKVAGKYLYKA